MRLSRPHPFELSYLSWGRRYYGEPTIAPGIHEGWHYFLILSGTPKLIVDGREIPLAPGAFSLGHPDCAIGHTDARGTACEMLTWIWRTAPMHSALRPEKGGRLHFHLNAAQVRRARQLHIQCRDSVADSDERSMLQLRATRMFLDLCLVEAHGTGATGQAEDGFAQAVEYLRSHVTEPHGLQKLCEYLQISKASLYRMFLERTGEGPRVYSQRLRMDWAYEQLRADRPVKEVAYALHYRHSDDFSRAFKQHFGTTASSIAGSERPASS